MQNTTHKPNTDIEMATNKHLLLTLLYLPYILLYGTPNYHVSDGNGCKHYVISVLLQSYIRSCLKFKDKIVTRPQINLRTFKICFTSHLWLVDTLFDNTFKHCSCIEYGGRRVANSTTNNYPPPALCRISHMQPIFHQGVLEIEEYLSGRK